MNLDTENQSNYELRPKISVNTNNPATWTGWKDIASELNEKAAKNQKTVLVIDCYIGVYLDEILLNLSALNPALIINSDDMALAPETIEGMLEDTLTNDRVFGVMTTKRLEDFFSNQLIENAHEKINAISSGLVLVYGVGASLITTGDILVYADIARWEIQLRYRKGMSNWRCRNSDDPILSKYKRGYFAEWRWADKHKKGILPVADYFLDTNTQNSPVMATGDGVRDGLLQLANQPFRVVPYFDPGVWGGQWMKNVCNLDKSEKNFAWSFDGVPEENSVILSFNSIDIELPAMNLTLFKPRELLGEKVFARFGAEFPIRFDFLDTMGGQNLSLQVHPLTEYIKDQFNMKYTQDESYYILDAKEGAYVYLGVKTGINKEEMLSDLKIAETGEKSFDAEKYINRFTVNKHDHVLIPAGTIHCSGADTMVLEISATPYIFTFKLWDWDRVGLDGIPRPIHLEHGAKNIQWNRDTEWVKDNLLHREVVLHQEDGFAAKRTGLHEFEFIETIRYEFEKPFIVPDTGSVRMLNLVEGASAIISSTDNSFEPFAVHYAETFILPESIKQCIISPKGCKSCMVICATVRV